jgi:hypothetical protein
MPDKPESPAEVVPILTEVDEPVGDDPDLDAVVGLEDLVIDLD